MVLPDGAVVAARLVAGVHMQLRGRQRGDQLSVGGDAVVGVLVDDREDRAAVPIAGENGGSVSAEVRQADWRVAIRERVVARELVERTLGEVLAAPVGPREQSGVGAIAQGCSPSVEFGSARPMWRCAVTA
jgi:hypothetical protein